MGNCNCKNGTNGTATACPECDVLQMARNHYFTGKLLVERDFTDEQRYTMGKLRRHNQRLHGWGAVCGLKVKQHPNPACQSQYVIIEPGTAIDCCGREILLTCEEYFDFQARFLAHWQTQNGPNSQPDTKPHTLQICISYKECATENVPALFDDCSPGSCQPNRILESRDFDVVIDPKPSAKDPQGVKLKWAETIGVKNVVRVVENEATGTLYALASTTATATLYAIDTGTGSVTGATSFSKNTGIDVQVSPAGDYVYVALQPTTAATAPQILVLATAALATTVNTLTVTGSADGDALRLAVVPGSDGRLLAVVPSANSVLVWGTDIQTGSSAAPQKVAVGTDPVDIAIDSGKYAYIANSGSNNVTAIDLSSSSLTTTAITAGLGSAAPATIAVANTTGDDVVAVLDTTAGTLYFISIPSAGPGSATALGTALTTFADKPLGVLLSPGARWAYVLEQDTSNPPNGYLQVVDVHAVAMGQSNILSSPITIAIAPENEALSGDGKRIYAPYSGNSTNNVPGAVAVIDVIQNGCPDLFKCALESCPDCAEGNCIILATIQKYVYQQTAVADSLIDNLTDRHLLVSTEILTRVVRCILDQGNGSGTAGPQGPPGINGATWYEGIGAPTISGNNNDLYLDISTGNVYQMQSGSWVQIGNIKGPQGNQGVAGAGITAVNATFVTCDQPGSASLTGPATSQTLNLTIPGCCNKSLVGIQGVSWQKNGGPVNLNKEGALKIAFSGTVQSADLTSESVVVLAPGGVAQLIQWEEVGISVVPGNFATVGNVASAFTSASGLVNGMTIRVTDTQILTGFQNKTFHILVKGDFIRDASGHGVDGNHLPPWLPQRTTGDGIEGGTFESWFVFED